LLRYLKKIFYNSVAELRKKRTYEYGKGRKTPEKRVSVLAYLFENK